MKKTNYFFLFALMASLSLISIDCLAQKDTLRINRFGTNQTMSTGKNKKFILENFSIESLSDSINFETISIRFPLLQKNDFAVKNVGLVVIEGDSLQNVFSAWTSAGLPHIVVSTGFDYFVQAHYRKNFSIVMSADVLLPNSLTALITLSGFDSRGQEVQVVVTSHDINFL